MTSPDKYPPFDARAIESPPQQLQYDIDISPARTLTAQAFLRERRLEIATVIQSYSPTEFINDVNALNHKHNKVGGSIELGTSLYSLGPYTLVAYPIYPSTIPERTRQIRIKTGSETFAYKSLSYEHNTVDLSVSEHMDDTARLGDALIMLAEAGTAEQPRDPGKILSYMLELFTPGLGND
jgi:hypothetical protein